MKKSWFVLLFLSFGGMAHGDSLNVRTIGRLPGNYSDLWVSGNLVYETDWTGYSFPAPMRIIDITDPSNPTELSSFIHPSLDNDYDIAVYGNYAYIANQAGDTGMIIVDCSDPNNPVYAGAVTTSQNCHTNFIVGNYLLCSNYVEIYDLLPNPENPTFLARLRDLDNNLGCAHEISVVDSILYVSSIPSMCGPTDENGAFLYDFTNPANPTRIGRAWHNPCAFNAHSAWPSDLDPRYVLVTDEVDCGYLHIWDFINPSNPVEVSEYNWKGAVAHQIMTEGKYAYLAYWGGGGFLILDLSIPSCPQIAGFYDTPDAWGVDITKPPYIYVSDMDNGLYVFEFTPPFVRDVGVNIVFSPSDTVLGCADSVSVSAMVCNNGDTSETFPVVAEIFDTSGVLIYADTQTVNDLLPDSCLTVSFSEWLPPMMWCDSGVQCGFTYTVNPRLLQDQQPCNDTLTTEFCVDFGTLGVSEEHSSTLPSNFVLSQNHPNPFTGSTEIQYQLPEKGVVSLKLYDTSGKFVRSLVNGLEEGGIHQIFWDGKDDVGNSLPSGIYFYKLEAGESVATKRLVLLR